MSIVELGCLSPDALWAAQTQHVLLDLWRSRIVIVYTRVIPLTGW